MRSSSRRWSQSSAVSSNYAEVDSVSGVFVLYCFTLECRWLTGQSPDAGPSPWPRPLTLSQAPLHPPFLDEGSVWTLVSLSDRVRACGPVLENEGLRLDAMGLLDARPFFLGRDILFDCPLSPLCDA